MTARQMRAQRDLHYQLAQEANERGDESSAMLQVERAAHYERLLETTRVVWEVR